MNNTPRIPDRSAFTLIELLIVIAIIGILMSLLFPAVNGAIDAAKKAQAKNDVTQIATAVIAYETEYGKLPAITPQTADATVDALATNGIIGILMGIDAVNNPRGIVFLEVQDVSKKKGKSGIGSNGYFCDPWGNTYKIALDYNYDNTNSSVKSGNETSAGQTTEDLRKKVAVFNITDSVANSKTNTYFRHVVKSW